MKIEPLLVARKDDWTRFVTAAQARRAPCIVETNTIPAAANGYLMPIDKFWNAEPAAFRNAWSADVLKGSRYQGKLYGVPVWGGVYGEIYNRKMVEAAGLDPNKPPTSWDEYVTWMKALTKPGQWGTAITAGSTDTTTRSLLSWIWSNGGEAFNADMTEATFASNPKSLEAIKFYIGLVQKGYAAPGPTTTNYLEQTTLFAQGKIASMRTALWGIAKVEGDNPALKGQMVVGPPPATIPDPPVVFTQAVASIGAGCAHPDEAWKFITFESGKKWAAMRAEVADWLPLRRDMLDDPAIRKSPDMLAFLKMAQNARAYPLPTPVWSRYRQHRHRQRGAEGDPQSRTRSSRSSARSMRRSRASSRKAEGRVRGAAVARQGAAAGTLARISVRRARLPLSRLHHPGAARGCAVDEPAAACAG